MNASAMEYLKTLDARTIGEVLQRWKAVFPAAGVLALLPEAQKGHVATLQQASKSAAVPVVGAVFPALLHDQAFVSEGMWLLRFDEMPYAALYPDLPRDETLDGVLDDIVTGVTPHLGDHGDITLCMLFDAMVPHIGTILDGLYLRLADRVHYMGVNAGSETFQPMPCLFDGERIIQNGTLVLLLKPHRGAVLEHGYEVAEQMIPATSTAGNRILQIDWRPAFDVYREMAREQYGVEITRDNFYEYAVHFPFGILRANGITVVRIPVALEEDGSLFCVGEVPANAMLTLLRAPAVDSRHTIATLINGLSEVYGGAVGRDIVLFYCAGRRLHLGIDAATDEVRHLAADSQCGLLAGALSLGEIGSTTQWGYPLFHNGTLVTSVWNMPD